MDNVLNKPRTETERELRIWPTGVAAQSEPMPRRVVPENAAFCQMKSRGRADGALQCPAEIAGAHELLLFWLWKRCVRHHCSGKHDSRGRSCARSRMLRAHNLMPMQSCFGAQQSGYSSAERVVARDSCSTQAVKMTQPAIKATWLVIYEKICPMNSCIKG